RGQVFALLFHASQNAAPLHSQNINPVEPHHAAESTTISITKNPCAQISKIHLPCRKLHAKQLSRRANCPAQHSEYQEHQKKV
ncbi:MAG: hypothetical protein ACR2IG_14810, partial [Roseomonas sp.]